MIFVVTDVSRISLYYNWCLENFGSVYKIDSVSFGNSRYKILEHNDFNTFWELIIFDIEDVVAFKLRWL